MGNDEKADTGSATAGSRRLLLGSGVVRGRLGRQEIGLGDLKSRASEDVSGPVQCVARMKLRSYSP